MNHQINHSVGGAKLMLAVTLLVFAFLLAQPGEVAAQTQNPVTTLAPPGGTIGKIPKWKAGTELEDSVITQLNGNIGIGTTNPQSSLHVVRPGAVFFSRTFLMSDTVSSPQSAIQLGFNGGTMAAGGGPSILFFSDNSDHLQQYMGRLTAIWENPLAGAETAGLAFNVRANSADTFAWSEAMRVTSAGNLGIGTAIPAFKLQIDAAGASGGANAIADGLAIRSANTINGIQLMHGASTAFIALNPDSLGSGALGIGTRGNFPLYFYTNSGLTPGSPSTAGVRMAIDAAGRVGIGTLSPSTPLHVMGNATVTGDATVTGILSAGTISGTALSAVTFNGTGNITTTGGNVGIGTASPTFKLHVVGTGKVTGDLTVDGTIQGGNVIAKYQDVAEWVPASRAIAAGTVVVLDAERSNHVLPSSLTYDTRVAGVVSSNPGVLLGEGGAGKIMVATTGRVRVKVDATRAPIRVGDLLVTSDREGIAMRSLPLELGGAAIHRPGTLIGKALEPFDKGVGEILVLLSLQ